MKMVELNSNAFVLLLMKNGSICKWKIVTRNLSFPLYIQLKCKDIKEEYLLCVFIMSRLHRGKSLNIQKLTHTTYTK